MRSRLADIGLEVAMILLRLANQLHVFVEFAGVVCLGKNVLKKNGMGYPDRLGKVHRRTEFAALHVPVALKPYAAYLHLRSLTHHESDVDAGRGQSPDFGSHCRELVAM